MHNVLNLNPHPQKLVQVGIPTIYLKKEYNSILEHPLNQNLF